MASGEKIRAENTRPPPIKRKCDDKYEAETILVTNITYEKSKNRPPFIIDIYCKKCKNVTPHIIYADSIGRKGLYVVCHYCNSCGKHGRCYLGKIIRRFAILPCPECGCYNQHAVCEDEKSFFITCIGCGRTVVTGSKSESGEGDLRD